MMTLKGGRIHISVRLDLHDYIVHVVIVTHRLTDRIHIGFIQVYKSTHTLEVWIKKNTSLILLPHKDIPEKTLQLTSYSFLIKLHLLPLRLPWQKKIVAIFHIIVPTACVIIEVSLGASSAFFLSNTCSVASHCLQVKVQTLQLGV